jgi:hypothetical protein
MVSRSMDSLQAVLNRSVITSTAAEHQRQKTAAVVSLAVLSVLLVCWFVALRTMNRWRLALPGNQERRAHRVSGRAPSRDSDRLVRRLRGAVTVAPAVVRRAISALARNRQYRSAGFARRQGLNLPWSRSANDKASHLAACVAALRRLSIGSAQVHCVATLTHLVLRRIGTPGVLGAAS